ncbi:MAG: hypothetical protein ACXVQ6_01145 [Actinomycetota bacterium]
MHFAIESWAPEYGASIEDLGNVESDAQVERNVEIPEDRWAPISPSIEPPSRIAFVDGTNRIDAQVWISEPDGDVRPGLCATYAAGAALCDGRATITDVQVRRGLFTASASAEPITTGQVTYEVRASTGTVDQLAIAVIERMRQLEAEVARGVTDAELIVLDGLLWGRADIPHAIGYVKSHRTPYLPAELNAIVSSLGPGQRTPLFLVSTSWTRFSWYVRLPGASGHPWSGVVRCEATPDLSPADAATVADGATAALPRFASSRHRDPRAPQNLYPIGGLERELRRRSGDARLIYRSLLASAV